MVGRGNKWENTLGVDKAGRLHRFTKYKTLKLTLQFEALFYRKTARQRIHATMPMVSKAER